MSLKLKNVENEDVMESIDSSETLDEKEKNNAYRRRWNKNS